MVDSFKGIAICYGNLSTIDANGNKLIARIRSEREGLALPCANTDRSARCDRSSLGGFRLNGIVTLCRGSLKGHINRMVNADCLKGVVADGAKVFAINDHTCDLIALIRNCSKGLGGTLADEDSSGRRNRAVLACRRSHCNIILCTVFIDAHIVKGKLRTAGIAGIDKGKTDIVTALIMIGNNDLGLRSRPVGIEAGIAQIPDRFPCCAIVL